MCYNSNVIRGFRGLNIPENTVYLLPMKLKNTQEIIEEQVDSSTGEVTHVTKTISKTYSTKVSVDAFYITFLKALGAITDLGSSTDRAVLDVLCTIAEFDTGVVFLPAFVKDEICTTLGIKKQTLSNSLTALRKKGIISMDRGRCLINPNLFWKGAIDKRESLLRDTNISLTFSIDQH